MTRDGENDHRVSEAKKELKKFFIREARQPVSLPSEKRLLVRNLTNRQ